SDSDFTDFFQEYIQGTKTLPDFENTLLKIGLRLNNFVDEYYIEEMDHPKPMQQELFNGMISN
ncbi:MAG: hypothetical protein L3J46_03140, partial [Kangiellaceae bacterium]|nr:hypothetical protein [Kangiellaceae bacterium]